MSVPPLRSPTVPNAIPTVQVAVRPAAGDLQHPLGPRVGGQVEVGRAAAEEHIPHRPADERELVTVPGKEAAELGGDRRRQRRAGGPQPPAARGRRDGESGTGTEGTCSDAGRVLT